MRKLPTPMICSGCDHRWSSRANPQTTVRCPKCGRGRRVPTKAGGGLVSGHRKAGGPAPVRTRPAATDRTDRTGVGAGLAGPLEVSGRPVEGSGRPDIGRRSLTVVGRPGALVRPAGPDPDAVEPLDPDPEPDPDAVEQLEPDPDPDPDPDPRPRPRPRPRAPWSPLGFLSSYGHLIPAMLEPDLYATYQAPAPARPAATSSRPGPAPARPALRPAPSSTRTRTTDAPGSVRFRTGDAAGRCEVWLSSESGPCSHGASGTFKYRGRSTCASHYDILRARNRDDCEYRPQTYTAPESSEAYWLE